MAKAAQKTPAPGAKKKAAPAKNTGAGEVTAVAKEPKKSAEHYVSVLCAAISTTDKGMNRICKAMQKEDPGFPSVWAFLRMLADSEAFTQQYARAKEEQADVLFDQIIEISDDDSLDYAFREDGTPYVNQEHIQRSKLRVDSRKWAASKLRPKKYGDKISVGGDEDNPLRHIVTVLSPEDAEL